MAKARPHRPKPQETRITRLMRKQAETLFENDLPEQERFLKALVDGQSREQAILILEDKPEIGAFPKFRPLSWQPPFVQRIQGEFRPAKHPLYEKGAYYSLDFSSVFAASAMLAIQQPPKRVLDLCSSPGGKAIFAYRAFRPELIYCNETIRKRCTPLIENLRRCHVEGSAVGSADPSVWARRTAEAFDLVLVDAPCSGQSLLAKGREADGCFHPNMIDMCVGRQRRILGNAFQCVRPGGHILYMTCTFAKKENEKVIEWLLKEYEGLVECVRVPALEDFRSAYFPEPCYRLFPQSGIGAGAFATLLRKAGEPPAHSPSLEEAPIFWKYGQPDKASNDGE